MDGLPAQDDGQGTPDPAENPEAARQLIGDSRVDEEKQRQRRKAHCRRKFHKAPVWIEAACAILLVIITGTYTYYAARQANAAKKTAKAAFDAINEAKRDNIASINAQQQIAQTALAKAQENFAASSTAAAKQFADTLKQMQAQTRTQGIAAAAAKGANEIAGDALRRSQRPWIGIFGAPVVTEFEIGLDPDKRKQVISKITFVVKNYGTSPGIHVNFDAVPWFFNDVKTAENFYDEWRAASWVACALPETNAREHTVEQSIGRKEEWKMIKAPPEGITIFPNEPVTFPDWPAGIGIYNLPADTVDHGMYIIGCVVYDDQFGKRLHHTRFCYRVPDPIRTFKAPQQLQACEISAGAD